MALAFLLLIVLAVISLPVANAEVPHVRLRRKPGIPRVPLPDRPVTSPNGTSLPSLETVYQFKQWIDHNDTGRGTFKQRYWANWEFYESGGPIILMTPGEDNADGFVGYLTNLSMLGNIAQQQQGATVLLEHRFFGYSNPYDNLHSSSLEFLTIEQAIEDLVYFTQNVELPFLGRNNDTVKPGNTSWVLVGGSYAGALTSWTMVSKPGIFHAGYASSAVVEAIVDYYDYFTPIRENMPQNCSADVESVVTYLDQIYAKNDTDAIQTLKNAFGLGNLTHVDDFAAALQYNLFDWQKLQPSSGPGSLFYQFCDALEVKEGVSASASGWGLENAIFSWGSFWNNTYYQNLCDKADVETCLGSYDPNLPYWTNVSVNNSVRSWDWIACNQIGSWASGPPEGQPAIVSRILQPIYNERLCTYMFPEKFPEPQSPSAEMVNTMYEGWNVSVDRLFFGNGRRDPWLEETVSAEGHPNTTNQIHYESDGFHTSDMTTDNGLVDDTIRAVQIAILQHMKEWLA